MPDVLRGRVALVYCLCRRHRPDRRGQHLCGNRRLHPPEMAPRQMANARVPQSWLFPLGVLKAAGVLGLLVGIGVPPLGVAACSRARPVLHGRHHHPPSRPLLEHRPAGRVPPARRGLAGVASGLNLTGVAGVCLARKREREQDSVTDDRDACDRRAIGSPGDRRRIRPSFAWPTARRGLANRQSLALNQAVLRGFLVL